MCVISLYEIVTGFYTIISSICFIEIVYYPENVGVFLLIVEYYIRKIITFHL
jgi:hypothetical protein